MMRMLQRMTVSIKQIQSALSIPIKPSLIIQKDVRILPAYSVETRNSGSQDQHRAIKDRTDETDSLGAANYGKSQGVK